MSITTRNNTAIVAGVLLAVLLLAGTILQATEAAFSATTDNSGNAWALGTLTLTDDDGGSTPMFDLDGLNDGDTGQRCIAINYSETLNDAVALTLHGDTPSGGETALNDNINLVVERGSGGTFAEADCSSFATPTTVFTGTLQAFNATTAAAPADSVAADGTGTVAYRFTYTVSAAATDGGDEASSTFTWTASS